jgi:Raf kinase inhibitor-like YbhB/YbcL family protein
MLLTSPSFENGGMIPSKFTCDGGEINPELQIQNIPPGTQSLALIVEDPDAPTPGGFVHWLVWNIDPSLPYIKEESVPPGAIEGTNSANEIGYMAPCPPAGHGAHQYHFGLYALDAVLTLSHSTTVRELRAEIERHLIDHTELIGSYQM